MKRIVFLLEERSMKILLEGLLPRFFPGMDFLCIQHEGKQDLLKSIPRKLRAWREPGAVFVVVLDNDGDDCRELKTRLLRLCADAGRDDTLVRIAVEELESWYFGDPKALSNAFGNKSLEGIGRRARFRDPDKIRKPSLALKRLVPEFQKISGARRMAGCLELKRNSSDSFMAFMEGIARVAE